jgi:hypothetical protein
MYLAEGCHDASIAGGDVCGAAHQNDDQGRHRTKPPYKGALARRSVIQHGSENETEDENDDSKEESEEEENEKKSNEIQDITRSFSLRHKRKINIIYIFKYRKIIFN